jgi:hypothetical protein
VVPVFVRNSISLLEHFLTNQKADMDIDLVGNNVEDDISEVVNAPANSPTTSIHIEEFERILEDHKNQHEHCWITSPVNRGLRDIVENRLVSHRSSNPELNAALRRLHQLRVQKKNLDAEILRVERLVEALRIA